MLTRIVKADLALCGKKQRDLLEPLRQRGYTIDAQRLSNIIGGTASPSENNLKIEKAIYEIIEEWKGEE